MRYLTFPSVIVDGLLMGVKANLDILTMSLGGSDGWTEGTGSVVSSRIAASGKIVTIAAGNEVRLSPPFLNQCNLPLSIGRFWLLVFFKPRKRH